MDQFNGGANGPRKKVRKETGGRGGGAGDAAKGRAGEGTAGRGRRGGGGAGDAAKGRAGEGTAGRGRWGGGGAGDAAKGRAGEGTAGRGRWGGGGAGDAAKGRAGEGTAGRGRWGGGGAGDAGKGRAGEGTAGRGRWGGGADARRVSERDAGRQGGGARMKGGGTGGNGGKESERDGSKRNYHGMGYKKLEELSTKDPSVVAMTLSFNARLEEDLSATTMKPDLVRLLCLVLSKAFTSQSDRCILQHLAGILKKSGFFRTVLPHYVMGMGSESNPTRRAQYPKDLENILTILSEVLSFCPASSAQAVGLLLTLLQPAIITLTALGVKIPHQTEQRLENIRAMIQHLQEKSRDGTLRTDRDTYALLSTGGEDNQQDFRFIPIYPTPEEFHQEQKPLLRPNLTSQRYSNTELYLDTHFRLLREDFVRPLREGIQELRRSQVEEGSNLKTKRFDDILVYFDTRLVVPKCTSSGLAYVVQFDVEPLKFLHWENSKRLIYGSLVCLSCDLFESFLFATVTDRDPKDLQKGQVNISFTEESRFKLATMEKDQVFLMVETTAYFEAYRHVLSGLQEQKEDNLPFQRYIVECNTDVRPPAYLQIKDDYDLSAIALPAHKRRIRPFRSLEPRAWPGKEDLGLDESQMRALQLALTKELAIIQGPPGTGKTYVGLKIAQALLTNDRYGSAPMLVVCYTNHALDQFLEGIHTFMKTGIVRVGGRSNSEILKQFNLRELSRSPDFKRSLPDHLQRAYGQVYAQLCDEERAIQAHTMKLECSMKGVLRESFLQNFISRRHWRSLNRPQMTLDGFLTQSDKKSSVMMEWLGLGSIVLQRETENADRNEDAEEGLIDISEEADQILADRFIEDNIRGIRKKEDLEKIVRVVEEQMLAMNLDEGEIQPEQSEDGWQMQRHQKKKMKRYIIQEVQESSAMTDAEEYAVLDVWRLSQPDRWKLYRLWVARYRAELCSKALESQEDYQEAVDRLAHVRHHQNIGFLKRAKVIGMTTTGAAKFRKILQEVQPRLVIVEEAAEVLEAHTVTTLSKACQHLILIGDHQQLRPSATVYELAKNFNLEMSMFERLVKMGLPFVRLDYQHRMRPEIARLLTPHIYAELENHPSVLRYDNIKGLKTNLFFVEHKHPEEMIKDGKSHKNKHEATFVVSLCRYLIFQGYKPEQITILTTYSGQLYCLRTLMPAKEFTGVKVHVVDKYQGEENDIVLLSLVRSNPAGKMGFLNIANRVCVALSRAKKGLYCIGDSAMLSKSELWKNIFHTLREKDQIGNALTLCCQNHPHRQIQASNADDFKQAPKGGCTEPCKFRLDCGHVCASVCHPYDPEHKEYKCVKKCQKVLCDLKHSCTRLCHETCPENCQVRVEKILPRCQHKQMVPCHQDPETFQCKVKVDSELKCGHIQQDACFYQFEKLECRKPCEQQLNCGHTCSGTCGQCFQGRVHRPCSYSCNRLLICSHMCRDPCTMNCPPCRMPCENCCVHSQCMKPCGQPCTPCMETCPWQCAHQSCSKLCHEPCDRQPCTQPCANTLDCGHPCIGLCGDKCPSKCRICHREEVTEIFFGTEDEPDAYFIQLEDCGHIIEYKAMDKHMGVNDNQQENEGEEVAIKLKECPKCKTPIRKNLRYGSHIKRCLAEIEMVKVKINGSQEEIDGHRETLRNQWAVNPLLDEMQSQEEYIHIITRLGAKHQTAKDLWALENKMHFLTRVAKLKKIQMEHMSGLRSLRLGEYVEQFLHWLNIWSQRFTDQQVSDLERELQRITLLAELGARCQAADLRGQSANIQSEVQTMTEVLEKCSQFTETDEHRVKEAMKELDNKVPRTGLGIKEEEKRMIVSALKMQPGHWFKCPNGHIYIITECGGATESRRCTDCNATIGGANHALARGNQVATEMDGSQHPAWSEANNLQNFQF